MFMVPLPAAAKLGIEVKMLTGDNILTARAIADELHMLDADHIAVEASGSKTCPMKNWLQALKKIQVIARSTPLVKMRVVKALKAQGNVVAVTGDGINDAPAIKNADMVLPWVLQVQKLRKKPAISSFWMTPSLRSRRCSGAVGSENFKRFIQFQLTVNVSSVVVVVCSILAGFETHLQLLNCYGSTLSWTDRQR